MLRRLFLLFTAIVLVMPSVSAAAQEPSSPADANPFFQEWTTPFGVPPFEQIKTEHFVPAFRRAIEEQRREIEQIATSTEPATFANTIEAHDATGALLSKVGGVFYNLLSANTTPELQAANREIAPMVTALRDDVNLNPQLWARIQRVWEQRDTLTLKPEQRKLLDDTYKSFVRGGAALGQAQQARLRAINAELSALGVRFSESLLHETNSWKLVIDKAGDLAGLPESVKAAGAEAAQAAGLPGKWVYTLQVPSLTPFLQYASNRDLRRQMFQAYTNRCDRGGEHDTNAVVARTAALRAERAQLLGYKTFAEYVLEQNMAKTADRVYALLEQLWTPARAMALREAAALQEMARKDDPSFVLEPWDWRYYAEKVKKSRYDFDDQALRPYFRLDRVREGAFYVANRLYGITFTERPELPVYHPEVRAFEVKEADGSHLGIFYTDYFPRPGKRVGAWSSRYREQRVVDGTRTVAPITVNVANFSRPAGDTPALLSIDEVETLFHELGHALNSLFALAPYRNLRGARDIGELPSQIMENWALEPEVLKVYAKHHQTGEPIPMALVDKLNRSAQFNQGFATVEYLAAAILDMDWHTVTTTEPQDTAVFEATTLGRIRMPREIVVRYRSPYFSHVFGPGGGYAAGYYNYIWSEVLDQDAFAAFKEKGLFDPATAKSFRENILERTGMEDAATLYQRFRGREPSVEPLLRKRGLKSETE
jgi:peptidyl-dipeptidase Dcp